MRVYCQTEEVLYINGKTIRFICGVLQRMIYNKWWRKQVLFKWKSYTNIYFSINFLLNANWVFRIYIYPNYLCLRIIVSTVCLIITGSQDWIYVWRLFNVEYWTKLIYLFFVGRINIFIVVCIRRLRIWCKT